MKKLNVAKGIAGLCGRHALFNLVVSLSITTLAGCAATPLAINSWSGSTTFGVSSNQSPAAQDQFANELPLMGVDGSFAPLHALFERAGVTDARFEPVRGRDFFAVDLALRYRMQGYGSLEGVRTKRQHVQDVLKQANETAIEAIALYLERVPPETLTQYRRRHLPGAESNADILKLYEQSAQQALAAELSGLGILQSEKALDSYWRELSGNVEESILTRGRFMRQVVTAPAVPFIKAWIAYHEATDHRGPMELDFAQSEVYHPMETSRVPQGIDPQDWALLNHFAPNIVHEVDPAADYEVTSDRFGRVSLVGVTLSDARPVVDTRQPTVYAYVDHKRIQGVEVRQLVYTLWHPEHPKLSAFDPEAGIMDGWTIRITLDSRNRPLDFESVSNCGCYYKNFPTDHLDAMANAAYPGKLEGKQYHVENVVDGEYDAIVPELVEGVDAKRPHDTWLYFSAGHHQLITIRSDRSMGDPGQVDARNGYSLRPYQELERLPFNGYRASLFDPEGLVRKAHRPECTMLTPSGLYHAGHARQRETQMIYFDDAVFDDPRLLETYLRLPPKAFGG